MGGFVHLHLHSEYSLLDGACRISEIPQAAKKAGHNAVALTDHGVMYGAVQFYNACKKEGIKPIIGCEVYVAQRTMYDKDRNLDSENNHLVLLVKNKVGYDNLIYLVSKGFTDGFYSKPRIDMDVLEGHSEGLICLSACLAGYIPRRIIAGDYDKAEAYARRLNRIFGDGNFYLEVQDHRLSDDKVVCEGIRRIHENTGIPMVATNDCHYLRKSDAQNQAVLMCIQTNNVITDGRPIGFETDEFYYKSTEEMEALFGGFEDSVRNTQIIADMCDFDFEFGSYKLPRYKPDNGMNPDDFLKFIAMNGFERKTKDGHIVFTDEYPREMYIERIEYELSVISRMGYSEYYLIVWDFVAHSKAKGIPVGPGRGSGAGSIIAYLIGITDIDSIRFGLLFERFLNPERVSMPDFDIDFCYNRRDEAIQYVREKYGDDHTSQIITFGTLAARAAVRDVGRALGMPYQDVDVVAKLIPRELDITLDKALETSKDLKELYDSNVDIKRLIDTSKAIEGMPRHSSIHAAGVVITELPITDYVPVAVSNGITVTQFDMDTIAKLGLLKFDFLALRYLTIIDDAEKQIKEKNPSFDITKIDIDDKETYEMISQGKCDGVFQLESSGMRQVLQRLAPKSIDDVIAAIALYRPGPMDSIPKYIEARHDPSKIQYFTPKLKPILDVTYGCIVYQEQVMQIFREIAGYSFGHADVVRRAIAKKHSDDLLAERQAFLDGAAERGLPEEESEKLFGDIVSFANYAFNKSHAAAYGVLSYRTAYLKCHYALEYESALLTSVLSSTDKIAEYIADCSEQGIEVLGPDINKSREEFHVDGKYIRFGLTAIKGIGAGLARAIAAERETGGVFTDIEDFVDRLPKTGINKRQLETLIKSGALDSLGTPRRQLLAVYDKFYDRQASAANQIDGQIGMFDAAPKASVPKPDKIVFPNLPEFSLKEKLALEKESCGLYFSGHILDEYSIHISRIKPERIINLRNAFSEDGEEDDKTPAYSDKSLIKLVGSVTKRVLKSTKKGEQMAFVTLEDETSQVELIVFPKVLIKYGYLLGTDSVVSVSGTVNVRDDEEPKILVETVTALVADYDADLIPKEDTEVKKAVRKPEPVPVKTSPKPSGVLKKVFLRVNSTDSDTYLRSKAVCEIFGGTVPVTFYFTEKNEYGTETILITPTDFVIGELREIVGEDNIVLR